VYFSCFLSSRAVFRGCSSQQSPEKCAPQRKSSGVFCVTYCAALLQADSGRIHLQRPHVLTLAGVVCRRPWSGLAVAGEPTALHNHLLRCLSDLHAAVGPRNLAHKLTRSAAAELVSNNTHLHTHTHVLLVCVLTQFDGPLSLFNSREMLMLRCLKSVYVWSTWHSTRRRQSFRR